MKHFLLGVLTTIAIIVIGGFAYLRLGLAETRADMPPSRLESLVMTSAVHASVRREAPEMPNPVAPTDENLIAGGKLYIDGCAGCHGMPGKPKKEGDDGTNDLVVSNVIRTNELQVWFLAEHLVDVPLVRADKAKAAAS